MNIEEKQKSIQSLYEQYCREVKAPSQEERILNGIYYQYAQLDFPVEVVRNIYELSQEIQKQLIRIYTNDREWFLKIVEIYPEVKKAGKEYFMMLVAVIETIAVNCKHPYVVYKKYFDECAGNNSCIEINKLLEMKINYEKQQRDETDNDLALVNQIIRAVPEYFKYEELQSQNIEIENQIANKVAEYRDLNRNIEILKAKYNELTVECESVAGTSSLINDDEKCEMEDEIKKYKLENENIRRELNECKKTIEKMEKSQSCEAVQLKNRKRRFKVDRLELVKLMKAKEFSINKIVAVRKAIENGCSLEAIYKIIEMSMTDEEFTNSIDVIMAKGCKKK